VTGYPVPPARPSLPPDSLLDSIALVEAISSDDVAAAACLLRHADLAACARVLGHLVAAELCFTVLHEAFAVLDDVGKELALDSSPGGTVLTLARQLCCQWWCDPCVEDGSFRAWALGQQS
jgi:hypothetical protein